MERDAKLKKTIIVGLTFLLFSFLLMFTEFTSSDQGAPGATVWIKIHRIQAVDPIETDSGEGADWRYNIWVYNPGKLELWIVENYTVEPNHDDIIVDKTHRFDNITGSGTTIIIDLFEDDATADISSSIPETGPGISISGKRFRIRYGFISNTIVEGDTVVFEGGYYKTSGEIDNRTATDEYDANLWLLIWDSVGPNAYFTYSPTNPNLGDTVQFTDVSPYPEGKLTSWLWDFGDDSTSTDKNPAHKYKKAGTYTVKLTVTDDEGATGTMSQTVAIKGVPFYAELWFIVAVILILVAIVGVVGMVIAKRRKVRHWKQRIVRMF